jgi:hypothetical protein
VTPFTGETSASSSIQHAGPAVRAAAATAHRALLGMASARLGVPVAALEVASGVVSGGGRKVSYGELVGGGLLNLTMPSSYRLDIEPNTFFSPPDLGLRAGQAPARPVSEYTVVGTSPPRVEIPSIVSGAYTYVHNVRVPGMLPCRGGRASTGSAPPCCRSTSGRSRTSRGRASSAVTTSSAWSRRSSTTRSRPPSS